MLAPRNSQSQPSLSFDVSAAPRKKTRTVRTLLSALALSLGLCALGRPQTAHAYAEDVHYQLALRSLEKTALSAAAGPASLVATAAVRSAIDAHARRSPALRERWVKRYPTPNDFDDWAFKSFLLLEPGARVFGIDRLDERLAGNARLLDLVAQASRHPDEDWRNRERLAYNEKRLPIKDARGTSVPADPAILNMGKLGALSSQAHAHYGLAQVELSPDAEVLKSEPRRFARKAGYERAPIITLAAEMAQIHLDLALVAALSDAPGAVELSWLYAGAGFHYLQDVGNQIHTVQVGLYDFFKDAFIERLKMGLLTGGGYVRPMRSLASIGIDILTNHHVLSEHLTQKRFISALSGGGSADGQRLVVAAQQDDPEFAARIDAALAPLGESPERSEFALLMTRALIEASSFEGADVYRATRAIALPILRSRFGQYDESRDEPDQFLLPRAADNQASYEQFFGLQEKAFRRVGTALRRWVALQRKAAGQDGGPQSQEDRATIRAIALERLVARQLHMLEQQELRLADFLRQPPELQTQPEKAPGLLAADIALVLVAGLGTSLVLRRRRRT
jgi:hypothetical protein